MHTFVALWQALLAFFGWTPPSPPPPPPPSYLVASIDLADEKSVFATVESANTVPARARIGGTVAAMAVKQGDWVYQGQLIAVVADTKLGLQAGSYDAQLAAAKAQLAQAEVEFQRARRLLASKAIAQNGYDQARTAYDVARSNVQSLLAQRGVVLQQSKEGHVLAPTSGRVIAVPLTAGSVVVTGDTVATVAEQHFKLRLKLPEAYAHALALGAPIRFDGADIGGRGVETGRVTLIYPGIDEGHVVADAEADGVSDYFVGERVRVWIAVGRRPAVVIPERLVVTRAGIDYVRLLAGDGSHFDVPVQRGQTIAARNGPQLEILSGLHAGDRLLRP